MSFLPSRVLTGVLLSLVSFIPADRAAAQPPQSPAPEIERAERELAAALVASDTAVFDRLLAPDFVLRGTPDIDRATWIANATNLCWGTAALVSEFRLIAHEGDTAIVGLVLATDQDPNTCERATVRSLLTDVWRQEADAWRLALRHSGPAGDLAAQFAREEPPPPLVEGSAELSLVNTGGNTDTQTLGVASAAIWRPGAWTTEGRVSFVRTAASSVETARSFIGGVRQSRAINARLDAFGRFEFRMNEFAGIEGRLSLDAGLGYHVVDRGSHDLHVDAGLGYSREDRVAADTASSAITNLGGVYRWRLNDRASIVESALLTAALDDGSDWRFGNALALTTTVNRVFSVKLSHELKFVNQPVAGFEKTDTILSAALVARF